MIDITQIRTHGRLAKTLKVGDVIVCQSFHYPFARIAEIGNEVDGYLRFTLERGDSLSVRLYPPKTRIDLVVHVPEVETPFGPAVEWPGPTPEQFEQVEHERPDGENPVPRFITVYEHPDVS